jgi:hypothetical protein
MTDSYKNRQIGNKNEGRLVRLSGRTSTMLRAIGLAMLPYEVILFEKRFTVS